MTSAPTEPTAPNALATAQPSDAANGPASLVNGSATLEKIQAEIATSGQTFDAAQLLNILRNMPGVFKLDATQGTESGNAKEAAAETLSSLSQTSANANSSDQGMPQQMQGQEPGPSSHPMGPPGQWVTNQQQADANGQPSGGDKNLNINYLDPNSMSSAAGARRFRQGRNNMQIGSEEWHRRKKESHKEVERRRRGNINEGIDALARIVPNGTGEKAKGAILSRSVQYIHHLKENEARNIEKWTLEKLLMDQAMGDLQSQIDEMKKLLEAEKEASAKKDQIIAKLKKELAAASSDSSKKRSSPDDDAASEETADDPAAKRQKVGSA